LDEDDSPVSISQLLALEKERELDEKGKLFLVRTNVY
jgi:hypothetical protein